MKTSYLLSGSLFLVSALQAYSQSNLPLGIRVRPEETVYWNGVAFGTLSKVTQYSVSTLELTQSANFDSCISIWNSTAEDSPNPVAISDFSAAYTSASPGIGVASGYISLYGDPIGSDLNLSIGYDAGTRIGATIDLGLMVGFVPLVDQDGVANYEVGFDVAYNDNTGLWDYAVEFGSFSTTGSLVSNLDSEAFGFKLTGSSYHYENVIGRVDAHEALFQCENGYAGSISTEAVPEPSAIFLSLFAGAIIGVRRRR